VTVQSVSSKLGVKGAFLIAAIALFVLSAMGLNFGEMSLSSFGLACLSFAFLYDLLRP